MKKKITDILEKIRKHILSESFKKRHRKSDKWFTREKILTFHIVFFLTLNLLRKTLQIELYSFLKKSQIPLVTKQAFCAARQKISYKAYVEINELLIGEFYTDNDIKLFLGLRLLLVDGSTLALPENAEIRDKYGTCSNQKAKDHIPMSRISHIYDPLNGIILHAIMNPYKSSERSMAIEHIKIIDKHFRNLIIFDRGYPSITLIFYAKENNSEVLIRCPLKFLPGFAQIKIKNGENDFLIELMPKKLNGKKRKEFQRQLPNILITSGMKIRVLVIKLDNGDEEYLITTLIDSEKYTYETFKELYNKRWGIEENYHFIKIAIEIENFSTKKPGGIEQEFYGTIFMSNVRALLSGEAQDERDEEGKTKEHKKLKYDYKINRNISLGLIKDSLIEALFDPVVDLESYCKELKKLIKKNVVPIRKGRTFKRKRKANRRHHMTIRRSL